MRKKPVEGHKCLGLQRWVEVRCECGWRSDMLRLAEQAGVYQQWRDHVSHCADATEDAALDAALNCR